LADAAPCVAWTLNVAERRTPNAERRTPIAERRTPIRRTPNAERPNADRRTPIRRYADTPICRYVPLTPNAERSDLFFPGKRILERS
jgi:hypothetical protein